MDSKITRVAVQTLGCKTNQAETESLNHRLQQNGYQLVGPQEPADIYILNSCTVTATADRKCRQMLRRARLANPRAVIVATGCYARRSPVEITSLGGVDLVCGERDEEALLEAIKTLGTVTGHVSKTARVLRTRSFVKIQDGCSHGCTYCIVPSVRGRAKSIDSERVLRQVKDRTAAGFQEIVLTGTNVGAYDSSGVHLGDLLSRILDNPAVRRLRLTSLQPQEITEELLSLWKDERLCRHFHMALQSGCQATLQRMKRRYTLETYTHAVSLIRGSMPDAAVTSDIIVGFPGEDEEEHRQSLNFCLDSGFAAIHIFPYSPRPGTAAANMSHQVDANTKRRRAKELLQLARDSKRRFQERFLGRTMPVLWEEKAGTGVGIWSGLTDNYVRVTARSSGDLRNAVLPATLRKISGANVWGEVEYHSTVAQAIPLR
ncbi:MAG: tRNA (N(6)-L-threonylcarbamoyladenosine(37)-C(2))-methylthiotransferase MtaB [Chloroflexi bacterium]|nr:tRNA (N(6)-L-threonylcarbamoyladenosine(37)-C(2))-methylthiotransferase MtaB [Chloroflexota bacterium]